MSKPAKGGKKEKSSGGGHIPIQYQPSGRSTGLYKFVSRRQLRQNRSARIIGRRKV